MESFMQPALYQGGHLPSLGTLLPLWLARWRAQRERTRQRETLARLSERELRGIGVTRSDVCREFARR